MKRLLAVVADGFEETELIAAVDCMRRLDVDVSIAGLKSQELCGAHGIKIAALPCLMICLRKISMPSSSPAGFPAQRHSTILLKSAAFWKR